MEKNAAQQKVIGSDVKKLLKRRTEPAYTLRDTSVRAEDKCGEERPETPDYEDQSRFGEVTALDAYEDTKIGELPPDLSSPEKKFRKY